MINSSTHIVNLAESLAAEHGNERGGDPFLAFHDYEVCVVEDDFDDAFEGLIRFREGDFEVFINEGSTKNPRTIGRRRFTAAHELGHFSLEEHRRSIRSGAGYHKDQTGFSSKHPMEREADIFAAHFLMPSTLMKRRYKNESWGAKEILDASNYYNTSITCAALRCQSSLNGNSTIILWGATHVRWQRMSDNWWFELPARSIRNSDQLVAGSATEDLMNGIPVPDCGFIRKGTTRSSWFKRVASWSNQNSILVEEAIPLGPYGTLTVLRPDLG